MSRFKKLSYSTWYCQYHLVWVPKYRYRVLTGNVRDSMVNGVQAICGYAGCEVNKLNVQKDHIHLIAMVPPKISISDLVGRIKGQTAMKMFNQYKQLKKKPYWGNHFWNPGDCVDTIGMDEEMIRKYVRYQEDKEETIRAIEAESVTQS